MGVMLSGAGLSSAPAVAKHSGSTQGPAAVAVVVAHALASGDAPVVCENLGPGFKRFLSDFLLRAVPSRFVPTVPSGASLQQRCVAGLTGDLADPSGDGRDWRAFRTTRLRFVVYAHHRHRATVCLEHPSRAVALAIRIHGRWLLTDLPSEGFSQRQARICRLG